MNRESILIIMIFLIALVTACSKNARSYQGYIEGENIYLTSPFSGRLTQMLVTRGVRVKKGELLFTLEPKPQAFSVNQLEASLIASRQTLADLIKPKREEEIRAIKAQISQVDAQIDLAKVRVVRYETLLQRNAVDKDTYDEVVQKLKELESIKKEYEANLELALLGARTNQIEAQAAEVESVGEQLNIARWQLSEKEIYAPADGVIFDTYYLPGEYVSAERAIASLLAPENVHIEFFVPLVELKNLRVGSNLNFSYEGSIDVYEAIVSYISPEAEYLPPLLYSRENSDKIVFRIKAISNTKEAKLFPGLPVSVSVNHER